MIRSYFFSKVRFSNNRTRLPGLIWLRPLHVSYRRQRAARLTIQLLRTYSKIQIHDTQINYGCTSAEDYTYCQIQATYTSVLLPLQGFLPSECVDAQRLHLVQCPLRNNEPIVFSGNTNTRSGRRPIVSSGTVNDESKYTIRRTLQGSPRCISRMTSLLLPK